MTLPAERPSSLFARMWVNSLVLVHCATDTNVANMYMNVRRKITIYADRASCLIVCFKKKRRSLLLDVLDTVALVWVVYVLLVGVFHLTSFVVGH